MAVNVPVNVAPKIPAFYKTDRWLKSFGKMSLVERLSGRIEEVSKKLPNMSLIEKREMWANEPYYEVAKLIVNSDGWEFPKDKEKK